MNDATIIGAGPAGSAAGILLARMGWAVNIIEQHAFPRDKVCGECLSALGVQTLDRLGLLESILAAGGVWLARTLIHARDGQTAEIPLPRPMLGISRHVLDDLLLSCARDAGATIRQPVRCEGIEAADGAVSVRLRDLSSNITETSTASQILLADGKSAFGDGAPPTTGDMGIKAHFVDIDGPRDAIELFACDGCYGGLAAIEAGRWNAAFSVPAARVRASRGDLDALFAELTSENRALARRVSKARRIIPWLASALPRFAVRKTWPPGVIPIGNAAAAIEPIGGEGMGLALRSAEMAAEALLAAAAPLSGAEQRRLRHAYDKLWRTRRWACRAAAMTVSSNALADVAMDALKCNDRISTLAMQAMGK